MKRDGRTAFFFNLYDKSLHTRSDFGCVEHARYREPRVVRRRMPATTPTRAGRRRQRVVLETRQARWGGYRRRHQNRGLKNERRISS